MGHDEVRIFHYAGHTFKGKHQSAFVIKSYPKNFIVKNTHSRRSCHWTIMQDENSALPSLVAARQDTQTNPPLSKVAVCAPIDSLFAMNWERNYIPCSIPCALGCRDLVNRPRYALGKELCRRPSGLCSLQVIHCTLSV
jgi:hypothetical protein